MYKRVHIGKVAAKDFNVGIVVLNIIVLITIYAHLNKILGHAKSWLQGFSGSSAVQCKLLGTFLSSIFSLDNHLITLDLHVSMSHWNIVVNIFGLYDGVNIVGGKLVGSVGQGNN